jgi:hypothetical protein
MSEWVRRKVRLKRVVIRQKFGVLAGVAEPQQESN